MPENNINKSKPEKSLKNFYIKLISVSVAVIIIINLLFNMIFAERLEKIDKILLLDKDKFRNEIKQKIRKELTDGLQKENSISEEDKILLYKLYLKLKKEFEKIDKNKL